jgi:hypothetical protein
MIRAFQRHTDMNRLNYGNNLEMLRGQAVDPRSPKML